MKPAVSPRIKAVSKVSIVLVGLGLGAPPASAEVAAGAPSKPVSLAAAAEAKVARLDTAAALAPTQAAAPAEGSDTPFFKTKKGVAVLVLMVGGIAYTALSRSKDAVHSPAR